MLNKKSILQYSKIQDPVFALSGISSEMSVFTKDVVSLFDDNLQLDESFVPAVHLYKEDHRGRKVWNPGIYLSYDLSFIFKSSGSLQFLCVRLLEEWPEEGSDRVQSSVDSWNLVSHQRIQCKFRVHFCAFYTIYFFQKLLGALCEALQKMGKSNDRFVEILLEMAKEYDRKFRRSFGMKMEKDEK